MLASLVTTFISGLAFGAIVGTVRLRARLRLYKAFVEERLAAANELESLAAPRNPRVSQNELCPSKVTPIRAAR